ncbi:hypothetical protein EsDP_00005173 [Epichloe bromicola]|uniref:Uncharacterized protein n=1 Tax=Epichloe bromicola TaxID=79588 RepID=A0ABQ0CTW2_9HYPO
MGLSRTREHGWVSSERRVAAGDEEKALATIHVPANLDRGHLTFACQIGGGAALERLQGRIDEFPRLGEEAELAEAQTI